MGLSRTPRGTTHVGVQHTPSGRPLAEDRERPRGWTGEKFFVSPGAHKDPGHPSRTHDVVRPEPTVLVAKDPSDRRLRRLIKRMGGPGAPVDLADV